MRALAAIVFAGLAGLAGCWTGDVVEPTAPDQPLPKPVHDADLELELRTTECFGRCPVFEITIRRDGTLTYVGHANVLQLGERSRKLTRTQLRELARVVDRVQFFELDGSGHPTADQGCRQIGNTTTCSFQSFSLCSDTPHTIVTVRRPRRNLSHTIDDAHCTDDGVITPLEQQIEAYASEWIGRLR